MYFSNNRFDVPLSVKQEYNFEIELGYNKILLPYPINVNRGNFVLIKQNKGKIALDQTKNNSLYSDLVWNNFTKWTKLNRQENWRFYFKTINNFTSYKNRFSFFHPYSFTGSYNLSYTFLSSNITFYQSIVITDCKRCFTLKNFNIKNFI